MADSVNEERTDRDCRFCVLPDPWRVVMESPNFRVLAGLGPLAPGYALIISKEHWSCVGALPAEIVPEFEALSAHLMEAQTNTYGASVFFEHGRSGSCLPEGSGEDLCHHAHCHFLPRDIDLRKLVEADLELTTYAGWEDVATRYVARGRPYVVVQDGSGLAMAEVDNLRPRYLRTQIATHLGAPELADWVAFPSVEEVRREMPRMRASLQSAHAPAAVRFAPAAASPATRG